MNLSIKNLTFTYQQDQPPVFSNLNFTVKKQTCSLLIPPSGSGKSTFFKLLSGLYPQYGGQITSGGIYLDDVLLSELAPFERVKHVSLLFQETEAFSRPTLAKQLEFILENLQLEPEVIKQKKLVLLSEFELLNIKDRPLNTLSGGQRQKAALVCALATDSELFLLDEPFANIDHQSKQKIITLLAKLKAQGKTFIIADHDPSGYSDLIDLAYTFSADRSALVETAPPKNTLKSPLDYLTPKEVFPGKFSWSNLSFEKNERLLLKESSFSLPTGKIGLLSGHNGVGKSTFFRALCDLEKYSGKVSYDNYSPRHFFERRWPLMISLMLQDANLQFSETSVLEELDLVLKNSLAKDYWTKDRLDQAVTELGLTDVLKHSVYHLSGGQKQKLQLLENLVMAQSVLLLDEPFANLDLASIKVVVSLLKKSCQELDSTILVTSHQVGDWLADFSYELVLADKTLSLSEVKK